jgi:hypothetical protein
MPDLSEIEIGLMGPRQAGYQVRPHQAHKEAQQLSQAPRLVYISVFSWFNVKIYKILVHTVHMLL